MIPENLLKTLAGLEKDAMLLRKILNAAGARLPDAIDKALPVIFDSLKPKSTIFTDGNKSALPNGLLGLLGTRAPAFADAGRAGPNTSVSVNVINNTSASVNVSERRTGDGTAIDIIIDQMVAQSLSRPGSQTGRVLNSLFGLSPALARR